MSLRIGSLFTGTGALDLAVMDVYDAEVVWHSQYEPPDKNGKEDTNQYAARILARHWPDVPNLGDITKVDWQAVIEEHGPIDILTGGFPCQDVSSAGRRAGLTADSRSGLWAHMAHAIHELNPRLVIIENVEGLLSAPAASDMEPCPYCVGDRHTGPLLRACGAVLGDLATLGLDAEWGRYGANEVGAPHRRRRIIIRAWPADADAADLGHERGGDSRRRGYGPADRGVAAANTHGWQSERWGVAGLLGGPEAAEPREGDQRERAGNTARDSRAEAVEPPCPACGCSEWMHDAGGFCAGCHGCTDPELGRPDEAAADARRILPGDDCELPAGRNPVQRGVRDDAPRCGTAPADADHSRRREDVLDLRPGQPDLDWGDYEPAIRRWERVLGRRAPWPTDALGRLSPVFTEWLMGLPDGWVTDTPGLTRPAMLRALGNGVVWQQAAYAIRDLHQRAAADQRAAA
ncbi:DNA cytosine methyltransferase [Streptomyces massasporeus]|uniref:DNA cytosine methyltransferase n=1 Tax=Streptomyces massasporeus TaxID=67324 RepID=UPI00380F5BC5